MHACPRCFPGCTSGKEPACQCRRYKRPGFSPWVGKIPWRRKWQATPVFLPGESHGQRSMRRATAHGITNGGITNGRTQLKQLSSSRDKSSLLHEVQLEQTDSRAGAPTSKTADSLRLPAGATSVLGYLVFLCLGFS